MDEAHFTHGLRLLLHLPNFSRYSQTALASKLMQDASRDASLALGTTSALTDMCRRSSLDLASTRNSHLSHLRYGYRSGENDADVPFS